jgi:TatA/E family protein of Tat protein translocase
MGSLSPLHWLIIAFIVALLFGNRLPSVMRSLAEEFEKAKKCQWCGRRMAIQDQACRHCRRPRVPPNSTASL